jgi:hypothetical protein
MQTVAPYAVRPFCLSLAKTRSGSQVVDLSAKADHNLVS